MLEREASAFEKISGTVERVVYHNPLNGWCVLKVKIAKRRKQITIVGHSFTIATGELIEASGQFIEHPEHGERLIAEHLVTKLPQTAAAAKKYLGSGHVAGIGPELAARLVDRFGAEIFNIIEQEPTLLRDVSGIGPTRLESIRKSLNEQAALRATMAFLNAHGLNAMRAPRILRHFGLDAIATIEKNPYRLAHDVAGIGFLSADKIARNLGLAVDSEQRIAAALHDRLANVVSRGHCAVASARLLRETSELTGISIDQIAPVLENEIESGHLAEEAVDGVRTSGVFPNRLARAEKRLAQNLAELASCEPAWSGFAGLAVRALSAKQNEALARLLASKVSLLTGGPGTGKTTLVKSVCAALKSEGWGVVCAAPTGRAAQRMSEASGYPAQTIHRLLGWDVKEQRFRFKKSFPLRLDLLIIDEASMVGVELMDALVDAIPHHASLLVVGDQDQLPSVQAGCALKSIIDTQLFTHVHLREIFRQANGAEDLIVHAARCALTGQPMPLESKSPKQSFHFIEVDTNAKCAELVSRLVAERIPERFGFDRLDQIQVLCPMNIGEVGARRLNQSLQARLNPGQTQSIQNFGQTLKLGDKVIVTRNDYDKEVFNGDVGLICELEVTHGNLVVSFDRDRQVIYDFDDLDGLSLAYAITVHKAQGSEYEAVVIPMMPESAAFVSRSLLYTALTRARKLVVMVGTKEALKTALGHEQPVGRRMSGLASCLEEALGSHRVW